MAQLMDLFGEQVVFNDLDPFTWRDGLKFYEAQASPRGRCGPDDQCEYEYLTGKDLARFVEVLHMISKRKAIFAFDFETSARKAAPVDERTGEFDLTKLAWVTDNKTKYSGSEPHTSEVFLLSLSVADDYAYVVDVREARLYPGFIDALYKALTYGRGIAHNFSFDWRIAYKLTGAKALPYLDTMVASQMTYAGIPDVSWVDPDTKRKKPEHNLGAVLEREFGLKVDKGLQAEFLNVHPESDMTDAMIAYAAGDTALLLKLARRMEKRLRDKGLWKVWQTYEAPFLPIISELQYQGNVVDITRIIELWDEAKAEATQLGDEWKSKYPHVPVASTESVLAWVQARYPNADIESVDKGVIESIAQLHNDKDLQLLLDYRKIAKIESTYLRAWVMTVRNPITGRIHCNYMQAATDTARLSSNSPNLQNIPQRGEWAKVRDCFIAPPGYVLIDADYSQFETRALADLSGEPKMIEFFRTLKAAESELEEYLDSHPDLAESVTHNKLCHKEDRVEITDSEYLRLNAQKDSLDFHGLNAEALFEDVYRKAVGKERDLLRGQAKGLSFGIPYGIGASKVAGQFKITKEKAQALIDKFFKSWPRVQAFLDQAKQFARYRKEISIPTGRKRFFHVPEVFRTAHSEKYRDAYESHWGQCERQSMNWRLQAINGDSLKLAAIKLWPLLQIYGARMVLFVHDEIVVECPVEHVKVVTQLVREKMIEAAYECGLKTCPISTSGLVAEYWAH